MIIRNKEQYNAFLSLVYKYIEGVYYIAEFKKAPKKRSVKQNNLFHMWIGLICERSGEKGNKDYFYWIKEALKAKYLPMKKVKILGKIEERPISTKDLDTKEFNEFLENVNRFFIEDGFYLPWPEDKHFEEFYQAYRSY